MIKTNKNIDYGASLTTLFKSLKKAEKATQSNKPDRYAYAYGFASMAIKLHLVECSDLSLADIEKELYPNLAASEAPTLLLHENNPENDIPEWMFNSHKKH